MVKRTKNTIPSYEQELILAHILGVSREYVLTHPEIQLTKTQETRYKKMLKRRQNHEPLAYILGHKEFYGLDFKVTPDTLIPRPETEQLVELALKEVGSKKKEVSLIDVGTGSGNIIISVARNIVKRETRNEINFYGLDISKKALRVAKYNAKKHNAHKKIKFIKGNFIDPILKNNCYVLRDTCYVIIVANLPYLSKKIYDSTMLDVKNFEPKSALLSENNGLAHYEKLFRQVKTLEKNCYVLRVTCYVEFSPEQKPALQKFIKKYLPAAELNFQKDLAGKWRVAIIKV